MITLIGNSKSLQELNDKLPLIAKTDASIFIIGETGVGKEVVAGIIHQESNRKDNGYIAINCAALPEELIENELFGHEEGAFTGASKQSKGKLEYYDNGTILLDEICDMGLRCQAKLLRVLQFGEFFRVGGHKTLHCNVRFLSATNKNIENYINLEKFRLDLYYRLNTIMIHIPPLRARNEDIEPLANYFIEKYNKQYGRNIKKLPNNTIKELQQYNWPGNVRELDNLIHRTICFKDNDIIESKDIKFNQNLEIQLHVIRKLIEQASQKIYPVLFSTMERENGLKDFYNLNLEIFEKEIIGYMLKRTNNNQVKTSEFLGICRNTLIDRIKKYNIQ